MALTDEQVQETDKVFVQIQNIDFDLERMAQEKADLTVVLNEAIANGYKNPAERRAEETALDPELVAAKEERLSDGDGN